ncbi:Spy/CpxP family protein refolding chaperone [Algivirga pacifica]|uniref:Periplasmic heavy metal sensor n=1 Tax=Algivirga pacifica TaxID=1162670 RepID=A0ABP9D5R1_9BACT
MKTTGKVLLMSILAVMLSMPVWAQRRGGMEGNEHHRREGQGYPEMGMMHRLDKLPDITEAQKESIKEIVMKAQKEALPLKNQMGEQKARLQTLSTEDKADMKAINKTIDKLADLKAQTMKIRAAARQDIRQVLNDEQRLIFDTHMQHRNGKHGHRKGPRGK